MFWSLIWRITFLGMRIACFRYEDSFPCFCSASCFDREIGVMCDLVTNYLIWGWNSLYSWLFVRIQGQICSQYRFFFNILKVLAHIYFMADQYLFGNFRFETLRQGSTHMKRNQEGRPEHVLLPVKWNNSGTFLSTI